MWLKNWSKANQKNTDYYLLLLRMRILFSTFLFILFYSSLSAQILDSTSIVPESQIDVVEDFLNNTDAENEFDFNTLFESLDEAASRKINLNNTSTQELLELGLIDEIAATSIISHIRKYGKLIALYELQTIDNLSMEDINALLPYVTTKGGLDDNKVGLGTMLREGKNEFYLRWSSTLEDQKGFIPVEDPEDSAQRFLGNKARIYSRFKHSYENKLSYGFTMEKDAGEQFFSGDNSSGFDFYSAHLFFRNISNRLKSVAIGDFSVRLGQGLILNSGFGRGKSADAIRIKRNGNILNAYTSVAENDFLRGVGATFGFGEHIELTVFGSRLKRDANIVIPDTTDQEEFFFSSLQTSGLHRTASEIADENSITQNTIGGNIKIQSGGLKVGANVLYNTFNRPFDRNIQEFNKFLFNSDKLLNASLDYSYIRRNVHFFGETAVSDNGGVATLNSLLLGLDRKTSLVLSYRNYGKDYQALNANAFGETTSVNNEAGLYIGLEVLPLREWKFNAYVDVFEHPWLRFNIDAPSTGFEYLARLTYSKKRRSELYVQYRLERKQRNNTDANTVFDPLQNLTRTQLRFHYKVKISSAVELRNRLEFSDFTESGTGERSFGYLLYQDIIYKPKFSNFSFTSRIAIFDTDDFNSRIFAFENDLLYNFSIPSYFNTGIRYYINLRYKPTRNWTLEFRIAQSRFRDLDVISSGLNEIQGNTRTDLRAQIRYTF